MTPEQPPFVVTMVAACCSELGSVPPSEEWWTVFHSHLPRGVLSGIERAHADGAITVEGWCFRFRRGGSVYQFFTRHDPPAANWEAFVHAALYGDFARRMEPMGYAVFG